MRFGAFEHSNFRSLSIAIRAVFGVAIRKAAAPDRSDEIWKKKKQKMNQQNRSHYDEL